MPARKKYNISNKRLFNCWCNIKSRCNSKYRKDSKYYHDKGISICEEWLIYENFESWSLNNGYADNLTIDRIEGTKGYSPENCRWITLAEQQRNKSNCRIYEYNGEAMTLAEWAQKLGLPRETLRSRIDKLGYTFEEAINKKTGWRKYNIPMEYNGQILSQADVARIAGVTPTYVSVLRKKGLTATEIISKYKEA